VRLFIERQNKRHISSYFPDAADTSRSLLAAFISNITISDIAISSISFFIYRLLMGFADFGALGAARISFA